MSTKHPVIQLSLSSLLLAFGCSNDYEHTPLPPTGGEPGSESTGGTGELTNASNPTSTEEGPMPGSSSAADSSSGTDGPGLPTDDSGTESSESSTTFPPFTCELSTHRCTAPVPTGWNGPVVLASASADAESGCTGDYATTDHTGFEGLTAAPPECSCSCGSPIGDVCDDDTMVHYYPYNFPIQGWNVAWCTNVLDSFLVGGVAAYDAIIPSRWIADPVEPQGGACTPTAAVDIAPASFTNRVDACAPTVAAGGACEDGGPCVPIPEEIEAPMCVWIEGEEDCPADYPNSRTLHDAFEDTRACASCACGSPQGGSCDDSVLYLWTGFIAHEIPADGLCHFYTDTSDGPVTSVHFGGGPVSGASCNASGGAPQGGVEATDAVTVCCE